MERFLHIVELLPSLDTKLISFLRSLSAEDWQAQTVARKWKVKDVVAHLLDVGLRQLSMKRDGWMPAPDMEIKSNADLVNYLNQLNADWVLAAKRLSPPVLIDLLEKTTIEVHQLLKSLDPYAPSLFPVSWAGETVSANYFDIAREFTEHWLHQQQIRDALGNKELLNDSSYYTALDIFMQAWPYSCRDTEAINGTVLKVEISGVENAIWFLKRTEDNWKLIDTIGQESIAAETIIHGDVAWKLFTKSVRKEDIKEYYHINGDQELGSKVLDMVSVMA